MDFRILHCTLHSNESLFRLIRFHSFADKLNLLLLMYNNCDNGVNTYFRIKNILFLFYSRGPPPIFLQSFLLTKDLIQETNKSKYVVFKGTLDNFSLIPRFFFFSKKLRSVYLCSDCMLNLILATSTQLQRYTNFSFNGHF